MLWEDVFKKSGYQQIVTNEHIENYCYFHNKELIAEFDTELQLVTFGNIFKTVRSAFQIATSYKKRIQILNSILNSQSYESDIARVGIEPFVLRLRLIYELYLNNIAIKFGDLIVENPIPGKLIGEILLGNDFVFLKICRFIHKYPAVTLNIIYNEFDDVEDIQVIIEKLIKNNLVAIMDSKLYFTARNPRQQNLKRFCWTSEWGIYHDWRSNL